MYLNLGLQSFGTDVVVNKIHTYYEQYKLPLISVGSGMGVIEHLVKTQYPSTSIICVDPNPTEWKSVGRSEPFLAPHYPLVDDLLHEHKELVGNCVLLLNWCCPNNSDYDYNAVMQLQPVAILTLVEFFYGSNGAAGGKKFFEKYLLNKSEYEQVNVCILNKHSNTISHKDIRLVWLQRCGLQIPAVENEECYPCQVPHGEDCIIS